MAKNKDPAFMFYPSDFMIGTFFMTDEEVGKYIRMLCIQHQQGRLSAEEMDSMCGNSSKIRAKFVTDENGMYYNERLDEEIAKRRAFCDKQRNNRLNATTKSQPSSNQTSTKLKPNSNPRVEDENENITIDINPCYSNNIHTNTNTTTTTLIDEERVRTRDDKLTYDDWYKQLPDDERISLIRMRRAIRKYFQENNYGSSPDMFITYNNQRLWRGLGGEDVRKNWETYADEWERKEYMRQV